MLQNKLNDENMKTQILSLSILALVFFAGSSFSGLRSDDPVKKEKKAHIKMIKNVDGKVTELDTVLLDMDAENIDKVMKTFSYTFSDDIADSVKKNILIKIDTDKKGKAHICKFSSGSKMLDDMDLDVSTVCHGDSLVKKILITTCNGDESMGENKIIWHGKGGGMGMPMHITTPKIPHIKMLKHTDDGNVIRLDDSSVVSYKKKDLAGNKEKIEIIREKPAKSGSSNDN